VNKRYIVRELEDVNYASDGKLVRESGREGERERESEKVRTLLGEGYEHNSRYRRSISCRCLRQTLTFAP